MKCQPLARQHLTCYLATMPKSKKRHWLKTGIFTLLGLAALAAATGQPAPPLTALLLIAAVSTALEQLSGWGIDNLTVPLVSALLWQAWLRP